MNLCCAASGATASSAAPVRHHRPGPHAPAAHHHLAPRASLTRATWLEAGSVVQLLVARPSRRGRRHPASHTDPAAPEPFREADIPHLPLCPTPPPPTSVAARVCRPGCHPLARGPAPCPDAHTASPALVVLPAPIAANRQACPRLARPAPGTPGPFITRNGSAPLHRSVLTRRLVCRRLCAAEQTGSPARRNPTG